MCEGQQVHFIENICHSACAENDKRIYITKNTKKYFSILALRTEGDWSGRWRRKVEYIFRSSPSARRATGNVSHSLWVHCISILALRTEGDRSVAPHKGAGIISILALRTEGDLS